LRIAVAHPRLGDALSAGISLNKKGTVPGEAAFLRSVVAGTRNHRQYEVSVTV